MPSQNDLALAHIRNSSGLSFSRLPNGALFSMDYVQGDAKLRINQVYGSPVANGMGQIYLRVEGENIPTFGPNAAGVIGHTDDRFLWQGQTSGIRHQVILWLHPEQNIWFWRVDVTNLRSEPLSFDALFIQDTGLGAPQFLMGNEAYASQYLDQHIEHHDIFGPIVMTRQNLTQQGGNPWVAHGCLNMSKAFATDFRQFTGPEHRIAADIEWPFGENLPSQVLQFESGCAALQTHVLHLAPQTSASLTFFGLFQPDHKAASGTADLAVLHTIEAAARTWAPRIVALKPPRRSILQHIPSLVADTLDSTQLAALYPARLHDEYLHEHLLSFFVADTACNRHVVLRDKERLVTRRHGHLMRSGADMLPNESTLSLTCWMHGIFGAQLTIGNTSFHQLFSISRDPYNITRSSGLRILADVGYGWQLLTIPSSFEMGLNDCRWIYKTDQRRLIISVVVSGESPVAQWRITVEGEPCPFLVFAHLTLGEREYASAGRVKINTETKSFSFYPDPKDIWGRHYPDAAYHLVTSTPDAVAAIGGDELLDQEGVAQGGPFIAMQTHATQDFRFAVTGSMTNAAEANRLAAVCSASVDEAALRAPADRFWHKLTGALRLHGPDGSQIGAINTMLPWLAHNALVHLTIPHGLEQYTGAAWGTRDVCQGPLELYLVLGHDEAAKSILRIIFAQQYEQQGDWPQWFMLEPYSAVQDKHAHGDVIIWPLKALCDYIEATGDFAILDEEIAWRREDTLEKTAHGATVLAHIEKLIATLRQQFIAGTHLPRYGNGDWNDSLQPVDPALRERMVSSWTVALLYHQLCRYAEILRRSGRKPMAIALKDLARAMRKDFNTWLMRGGTVAGYALFDPAHAKPELFLHPEDQRTGVSYSLLPMIQAITSGLFTPKQTAHHLEIIHTHLSFADGVRLMDRPMAYHGGLERLFRRAESAAFFGREIGLMYVHSHLRYAEAMAHIGHAQALWAALLVVNPISVTETLPHAGLRQRNSYFSSSDAAFSTRAQASAEWHRLRDQSIEVEGGWRIYSSGPGLYINMLIRHVLGYQRHFGTRLLKPCLPDTLKTISCEWPGRPGQS